MRQCIATICLFVLSSMVSVQAATVLIMGDSISAAYGLETQRGWVALLQERLTQIDADIKVVNGSVSGETTAGGVARLPSLLTEHRPQYVVIELGGNDGLRGLSLTHMAANLSQMIQQAKQYNAAVLLLGMRLPSNYGKRYTEAFYNVYQQVAEQEQVSLVDFFLEGVGAVAGMMQDDGVHPTQAAQPILLENAWQRLAPLMSIDAMGDN
ncbi:arylesterase [Denitrificimonas sp. JX-1]|uniref:Arylesterase n=1 Tax=Denitrificimonas halotolerans TaxID=3098930 RepID=A0ABU5GQ10_9GAMM|nr:arylesterase [Denitrificimonas sp. JX-1]MDY7219081.1 arylesterase [Denitrificimonas sp. JX-1]